MLCSTVLVKAAAKWNRSCHNGSEGMLCYFRRQVIQRSNCDKDNVDLLAVWSVVVTALALIAVAVLGAFIRKLSSLLEQ